jgi:hypothetical protein
MAVAEEVVALVAKKTGKPESSITPEKTFYQLGIDGDDAVELIGELCRDIRFLQRRLTSINTSAPRGLVFLITSFMPLAARRRA